MADSDVPAPLPAFDGDIRFKGRFTKGNSVGKGRPKGTKNRIITSVKQAMEAAIAKVGSDGKGRDGVAGYLENVARTDPSFMAAAYIRATVPPAKDPDPAEAASTLTVNIISVPAGQFLVDDRKYRLVSEGAARMLADFTDDGDPSRPSTPPSRLTTASRRRRAIPLLPTSRFCGRNSTPTTRPRSSLRPCRRVPGRRRAWRRSPAIPATFRSTAASTARRPSGISWRRESCRRRSNTPRVGARKSKRPIHRYYRTGRVTPRPNCNTVRDRRRTIGWETARNRPFVPRILYGFLKRRTNRRR